MIQSRGGQDESYLFTYQDCFILCFLLLTANSFAATFTVTNLDDSGAGSLLQAILDADDEITNPGPDDIVFIDGLSGTITILNANGEIVISTDITITVPAFDTGRIPQITIDADATAANDSRIFNITDLSFVTVKTVAILILD
ncbi:MAG: hypothetical protein AAF462_10645 [Thermodesulfobacteriota bacterium]